MNEMGHGRVMAVDYGRKRIGLALSDELGLTAQPLGTLTRTNRNADLGRLREICRKHRVARIVVGRPLHMTGKASAMSYEAARFAERMKKELGIEVEMLDERLTSWEAGQTIAHAHPARRRSRAHLDDVAAAILLREYLESRSSRLRNATEKD